jgi:hypothetical protein
VIGRLAYQSVTHQIGQELRREAMSHHRGLGTALRGLSEYRERTAAGPRE